MNSARAPAGILPAQCLGTSSASWKLSGILPSLRITLEISRRPSSANSLRNSSSATPIVDILPAHCFWTRVNEVDSRNGLGTLHEIRNQIIQNNGRNWCREGELNFYQALKTRNLSNYRHARNALSARFEVFSYTTGIQNFSGAQVSPEI